MSAIDIRPLSSVPAEPWRNGGGITRTLATNGKEWRVSVAQVEHDGPYSRFDGITRVSFVLRGRGVTLRSAASASRPEAVVALEPFEAVEYDGGIEWDASLVDGPVTALNVMSAAGRYQVTVDPIVVATIVPPGCAAIVIALESGLSYSEPGVSDTGASTVDAGQFMVVQCVDRPLRLEPDGHGIQPPIIVTIKSAAAGTTD